GTAVRGQARGRACGIASRHRALDDRPRPARRHGGAAEGGRPADLRPCGRGNGGAAAGGRGLRGGSGHQRGFSGGGGGGGGADRPRAGAGGALSLRSGRGGRAPGADAGDAGRLAAMAEALMAAGWPAGTPALAVARASLPDQETAAVTLGGLRKRVPRLPMPVLLLVGNTARAWKTPARSRRRQPSQPGPGLILMAHGSPLQAWQRDVNALARSLGRSFGQPSEFSRAAYLPPAAPSLEARVAEAVRTGVRRAVVVPYFLAPGLHVRRDIPALVAAAQRRFPRCKLVLADCLAGHAALRTAVLARAEAALAASR